MKITYRAQRRDDDSLTAVDVAAEPCCGTMRRLWDQRLVRFQERFYGGPPNEDEIEHRACLELRFEYDDYESRTTEEVSCAFCPGCGRAVEVVETVRVQLVFVEETVTHVAKVWREQP